MEHESQHHAHPGAATYVKLAVILGIITIVEVALHYIPAVHDYVVPLLLILTSIKFAFVVMYYMHLRFDARLLSGVFIWGLFIAGSVIVATLAMYRFTVFN